MSFGQPAAAHTPDLRWARKKLDAFGDDNQKGYPKILPEDDPVFRKSRKCFIDYILHTPPVRYPQLRQRHLNLREAADERARQG
jgi:hypothetical protein